MSDGEPITFSSGVGSFHSPAASTSKKRSLPISFNRKELNQILSVYGRKVAEGEWRDYAIDILGDRAVFSIFRRASEYPMFRVEKNPKLARRQGAYSVTNTSGHILRRGHNLDSVLRVLDKSLRLVKA